MYPNLPLVTVLMPVYNGEKYLNEAIDSILNQTFTDFEFLIINDGSIDNSEEIILSYKDPRIVYIKNEQNIKLISTLNKGLELSKGKYIVRIDADDIAIDNRLQEQVKFMDANPNISVCGSNVIMMLPDGNDINVNYPQNDDDIRLRMLQDSPFAHPAVIIRKSVLITESLKYNHNYLHIEDYQLWFKLSLNNTLHNLNITLLKYRVHNSQISHVHRADQLELNSKLLSEIFSIIIPNSNNNDHKLLQHFFAYTLHKKWEGKSILRISYLLNNFKAKNIHNYCNKSVVSFIKQRFWDIICLNTAEGKVVLKAYQNLNSDLRNDISAISKIYFIAKCYFKTVAK